MVPANMHAVSSSDTTPQGLRTAYIMSHLLCENHVNTGYNGPFSLLVRAYYFI